MSERFGPVDFDHFHTVDLPERLDGPRADAVAAATRGLSPIAFRLEDGRAYTYAPGDRGLVVVAGDRAARSVVELRHADWCDFVWEIRTSFALLYAGALSFSRGGFGHLVRWEPALRAGFDGQAVYDLDDPPPVLDAAGGPLDLRRTFTLDDSDRDLRDHLDRAGFVHLRGVFSAAEVAELRAVADAAVAQARPDDNRSWWTTVDGREACNRVNYLNEQSTVVAHLGDDERLRRIGALGGPHLRDAADRLDGHNLVVKVPGATTGLADLPWHRDCGMGGHPVKCPLLNVGIQLDAATAAAGQLHMIAGSHLGTSPVPTEAQVARLPTTAITTEPGDITVHYGHTLHAAPPPTDRTVSGRRAIYVTYVPPLTFDMVGRGQGYNDVLFSRDAGRVRHIDELT
ncbi:MAG TPA: phytanoyl-CoA dioxygenase family protein [Acidimicrobiales bacterium]